MPHMVNPVALGYSMISSICTDTKTDRPRRDLICRGKYIKNGHQLHMVGHQHTQHHDAFKVKELQTLVRNRTVYPGGYFIIIIIMFSTVRPPYWDFIMFYLPLKCPSRIHHVAPSDVSDGIELLS